MNEWERYRGRRVKFRCKKCRTVLTEFALAPPFDTSGQAPGREWLEVVARCGQDAFMEAVTGLVPAGPHAHVSRPSTTVRHAGPTRHDQRETWECRKRCGARYTLRGDRIFAMFIRAARAGVDDLTL